MKASRFFIGTLKEAPADAEIVSHKLMVRAGMIRRVAGGIYNYLPIGLRSIRKVEAIVREEMNRAGGIELLMPSVQPAELWQESGRWEKYGPELLRFKDRQAVRFRARTDARRSGHGHRAQPDQELSPVAGELLSGPDEVPRRDPSAFRRDARPRVHHERRVLVRQGRRRSARVVSQDVRRVRAHLHAPWSGLPRGRGGQRLDRRQRLARIPRDRRHRRRRDRLLPDLGLRGERRSG